MDINLITLLVQSGFAGLFIYLLIETRKEGREDKKLALAREEKLHTLVNTLMGNYASVSTNIQHIAKYMADMNANNQRVTGVLESLLSMSRRMQVEIGQIQGRLGIEAHGFSTKDLERREGSEG